MPIHCDEDFEYLIFLPQNKNQKIHLLENILNIMRLFYSILPSCFVTASTESEKLNIFSRFFMAARPGESSSSSEISSSVSDRSEFLTKPSRNFSRVGDRLEACFLEVSSGDMNFFLFFSSKPRK